MRRHNKCAPTWPKNSVELFHQVDYVLDMFDHVNRTHLAERIVSKRKWGVIEIGDYVCVCIGISIKADRARVFVDTAADIQNGEGVFGDSIRLKRLNVLLYACSACKHCSSVSRANSAWS